MPWNLFGTSSEKATTSTQLAKDISKLAKLGNVQNGLPRAMRGFPVAAIIAGNVYAKMVAKDGENVVEKAMLKDAGKDDKAIVALEAPGGSRRDDLKKSGDGEDAGVREQE